VTVKEEPMSVRRRLSGPRAATVAGLVAGALGIGILWASGVEFPFYPPPGMIILVAGALFVGLAPWRWAPVVGVLIGLFLVVGFLASGGPPNLVGQDGVGVAVGTWVQMVGVVVALIAGVLATRAGDPRSALARR
jgi:hypothetical protein